MHVDEPHAPHVRRDVRAAGRVHGLGAHGSVECTGPGGVVAGRVGGSVRSQIRKEVQPVVRGQRDVVREEGRWQRVRGAAVPDEAGVVQLGVAAGCEQRGTASM